MPQKKKRGGLAAMLFGAFALTGVGVAVAVRPRPSRWKSIFSNEHGSLFLAKDEGDYWLGVLRVGDGFQYCVISRAAFSDPGAALELIAAKPGAIACATAATIDEAKREALTLLDNARKAGAPSEPAIVVEPEVPEPGDVAEDA